MTSFAVRLCAVVAAGVAVTGACTREAWIGAELQRAGAHDAGHDARPDGNSGECHQVLCGTSTTPFACGDCKDNDADGKTDMDDPECLGPCQDDETTFATPMPGQGHGSCSLDCYFDQDNGSGNDDCEWSHACDPLSQPPDYPPEGIECAFDPEHRLTRGKTCATVTTEGQSPKCKEVCRQFTPNGCDCFGCCNFPGEGGASYTVFIGSVDDVGKASCDLEHIADRSRCKPCTQVTSCMNDCDPCEICVGKRKLDPSCERSGQCVPPSCGTLLQPCGLSCLPDCPAGESCITGCCIEPPR